MVAKAKEYLDTGYLEGGKVIPSTVGLSLYLGVSRQTIDFWGNNPDYKEFSDILDAIQAKQQSLLLNNGLNGTFNSAITKLVLGKHGYSERVENTLQGPGGGAITINVEGVSAGG